MREPSLPVWRPAGRRAWLRLAIAAAAFLAALAVSAQNEHAPYDIHPGTFAVLLAAVMPPVAAVAAAWAVERPWPAFVAILLLTPCWDAAQVAWQVGYVQVILQTVFVVALAAGWILRPADEWADDSGPAVQSSSDRLASWPDRLRRLETLQLPAGATVALLVLAGLSTLRSPDVGNSSTVLMHSILEPIAMAFLFIALRPTRGRLVALLIALGVSVALGGLIDLIQALPTGGGLASLQANRLLFSRLTYFNVGLLGEMMAMAAPLIVGALLCRRTLGLSKAVVALLLVAGLVGVPALFLTFSKSGWMATAGGALLCVLLLVETWRRRAAIVVGAALVSAFVVPWPALILQVFPPANDAYRSVMVLIMGQSRFDSWNPETLTGEGSLSERFYATTAGVRMAIDHPLLGIGLDQFQAQYAANYKPAQAHLTPAHAHSWLPEIGAELGLLVLALVVVIFAAALLRLWRIYRAPPDPAMRALAAILLSALVAWIIVATEFGGELYRPWRNMSSDYVMMVLIVAAALALPRVARSQPRE
ncbi:MAG TPA: O-antigen ligase family protein [Candidatus Limnocylindrales bacterium]